MFILSTKNLRKKNLNFSVEHPFRRGHGPRPYSCGCFN